MNKRAVGFAIGKLLQIQALIMLIPMGIGVFHHFPEFGRPLWFADDVFGFAVAIALSLFLGVGVSEFCRQYKTMISYREGYAIVALGWIVASAMGSLPLFFYFSLFNHTGISLDLIRHFTDAFFETMSGFTTTGSTILTDIEALPRSILFWRSMTHWLGGMGIVTLALAIFPAMGVSGYQMYKGEVPGPTKERLQPRLAETAKILWGVYLLFTVVETLLLCFGGMPLYDSLCHTFGTLATGGFSTKNLSIGYYQSSYFYWILTIFMFLSGINYLIHYRVLLQKDYKILFQDKELHFYTSIILICIAAVTLMLYWQGLPGIEDSYLHYRHNKMSYEDFQKHLALENEKISTLYGSFREASFQVVSIVTTTGFCTADFDTWPNACRFILLAVMFFGGCAGSTGGGIKMIRILTVFKVSWRELGKLARPRWIAPLKIGSVTIPDNRLLNILSLFNLFIIIFMIASVLMCLIVEDLVTGVSAVIATLFNIGPGLNGVGAAENYGWIPIPGKWLLSLCMLMGRLEVFSVLIALRPSIWRK